MQVFQPTAQATPAFQQQQQPAQPAQPAAPAAAPAPPPAAQHTLTPEEDWVCKAMASLQGRVCAAMQKKMADDVVKRLGELDAKLKAGQVSKEVTSQVTQWCQAMDRNDHATAGTIQTTLTSTVWDDHKNWLVCPRAPAPETLVLSWAVRTRCWAVRTRDAGGLA